MNYVTDDTMNAYLRTVQPMYDGVLGEIQREAIAAEVPIIPLETARLLSVLLTMQKPKHILEIGTAVGFSAGLMCRYLPEDGTVTTIDRFEVMLKDARVNIKRMGLENKIKILEGDAANILPTLEGPYDVIFLDAAKGQYGNFLPHCLRLLPVGGLLIVDDVLQGGTLRRPVSAYQDDREPSTNACGTSCGILHIMTHWKLPSFPSGTAWHFAIKRKKFL